METNNEKKTTEAKDVYSYEMLLNDAQKSADDTDDEVNPSTNREHLPKLAVLQMLLNMAHIYSNRDYSNDDKLRTAIEIKVDGDELLSGYVFFVSQNSQFDYSWTYMRKRKIGYMDFLFNAIRFLQSVVTDINMLAGKLRGRNDVHVLFNDIFDVFTTSEKPYVCTRVLWDKFYGIAAVRKEYSICVRINDCVLLSGNRNSPPEAAKLIERALRMINSTENNSK